MPPKKKEKKKKKKKDDTAPTVDDKYKQTLHQIESLKSHLALQTEVSRRSLSSTMQMRDKVHEATEILEAEQKNKLDISADLTRQYKSMQTELSAKIHILEQNVDHLQENLARTEAELKREQEEKRRVIHDKDEEISELKYKIEHMEAAYENILHDALDLLGDKINDAKLRWRAESYQIQQANKERLLQFGLNPLDI